MTQPAPIDLPPVGHARHTHGIETGEAINAGKRTLRHSSSLRMIANWEIGLYNMPITAGLLSLAAANSPSLVYFGLRGPTPVWKGS
jgi:hypothetical protein